MIDQFSVRLMVLIGCGFNLAGAFVKLFAFKSNLFPILFIGQVLSQVTWSVINQIGGKLANQWCPESEISLATGWKLKKLFRQFFKKKKIKSDFKSKNVKYN